MTTSRSSVTRCASLAILLSVLAAGPDARAQAPADECSNVSPSQVRACVAKRIARKEALMARLFRAARKAVDRSHANYGSSDNRTHPRFLVRSQTAWNSFVAANCTLAAAYGGGSNSAVSDREADCHEEELDRRIDFLRDLAHRTGRFGP